MSKKNKKTVWICIIVCILLAIIPVVMLQGAEFGGSDDAGSEMVSEIDPNYQPWYTPVLEQLIGGEMPGELESLLFCVQTGIGCSIIFYFLGRFVERKKLGREDNSEVL